MDLRHWADRALAALFDPVCVACHGPLGDGRRGPVCAGCWAAIRRPTPPWCARCGDPLATWSVDPSQTCHACRTHPPAFDAARAAGIHTGAMRGIVHALKYGHQVMTAPPLAALMRDVAQDWLADAVGVPVPLHAWRSFRRGFNQADALARALGVPVWSPLRRRRPGRPQAGLRAAERRDNVAGLYVMRRYYRRPVPPVVVLVDDVMTTGATADACARVLKSAGVERVYLLTASRAVSRMST
jgi:predicted amidophosphoribosyltransferase